MPVYTIPLTHKTQTKCNDCWYASIQMLETWQNAGAKTKPSGAHTMHLHSGILGHRLHADLHMSKHFQHVLTENGLICLPQQVLDLTDVNSVYNALQTYGPIMVGGNFGELMGGLVKNLGHFVVLAGVRTVQRQYMVHDPWENVGPKWMTVAAFNAKAWGDDESSIVVDPPPAVNF